MIPKFWTYLLIAVLSLALGVMNWFFTGSILVGVVTACFAYLMGYASFENDPVRNDRL